MEKLLPDVLKELWQTVDEERFTGEQFYFQQEQLLDGYRKTWKAALLLKGYRNLKRSILAELGSYAGRKDLDEVERMARKALDTTREEWEGKVNPRDRQAVEKFYDESQGTLYELMWWHALAWDTSPLAYVTALEFARQESCRKCLDFGAGVGSGAILFARHGFEVALADISSPMLRFAMWRFRLRGLSTHFIDLKKRALPKQSFDLVTAMDVFEHLFDPAAVAERLWESLKPRGFLFARFGTKETEEDQPQHIVHDFEATFQRMRELGFVQVWQDEWLWGHQVFQKSLPR